jgi:hypothetical protein
VPAIWLEFDDIADRTPGRMPSMCVCLAPGYRFDRPPLPTNWERERQIIEDVLTIMNVASTPARLEDLTECFRELPGRWIHLSVMSGRRPPAVKLYGSIPRQELLPYLARIGWSGDRRAIAEALDAAYGRDLVGDQLFIDLNLDNFRDGHRCTLGLAAAQQHVIRGEDGDPARRRILDRWIQAGLAAPEKAEEARGWVVDAPRSGHFLDLKLVWQAGAGLTAKAYLGRFGLS